MRENPQIIADSSQFRYAWPDMNPVVTNPEAIEAFLTRGVERVFPSADFLRARLAEGKPLTMYFGIDPTGPALHLGHAINLRKLRAWQDLGHKVVMLIGDFTAMIGDPTDKAAARKALSREEVLANAKSYKEQAGKILRFDGENPVEIRYNSEWLAKMTFADVVGLASHFTVQQMLERDMFEKRLEEGKPIHMHEFLYPLMQGHDSVALKTDGEIGGNDQSFNMLAGRDLMKAVLGKEKFVVAMKLLTDPTGKKMGKSEGNMITLGDSAEDMYGKVMSWPDGMIMSGFEILTDLSSAELRVVSRGLSSETLNPRDAKDQLARLIVASFHGQAAATAAAEGFVKLFQKHETPEDMPELKLSGPTKVVDALVASGAVASKSDARRQMEQGGVKVDGDTVTDVEAEVTPGSILQKGKRHFVKLV